MTTIQVPSLTPSEQHFIYAKERAPEMSFRGILFSRMEIPYIMMRHTVC